MTEEDYRTVGFKSGLEIHQQLYTEKKLFCHCPAGIYSKQYDAEILRHMRPTLSEMGVYDGTALMEFKTKKEIIYRINRNTVCTYEMDDTPPFLINEDALDIALGIGMLYNCNIVDELHIARKQYLDGSIPTGFQRTAIYGVDGWIPYKDRKVKIVQMSIEEDSCREVLDVGHDRYYNTDRLGMPLIETVTEPAMRTPFEVAEVGHLCSSLVRSTHKVRRGIGVARQDVNVSVTGGTRVEIKGVPRIPMIPLLTYTEAMRQWSLLRLREELKRRGITQESFKAESSDITNLLKKISYAPLINAIISNFKIKCVILKGFNGLLHWQTQTNTFFSKEISDRVRVIACLTTIPNIIHSDSKSDTITSSEWQKVSKAVNASNDDTMVIVWGSEEDTTTAVKEIIIRVHEATIGIPSETRQALSDGTNGFERILPGADRMYPDTDLPPKKVDKERLDKIKLWIPEQFWKRQKWYHELGIPPDTVEELSISKYAELFKKAVIEWKINPTTAAVVLIQYPKRLKKNGCMIELMNEEMFEKVLKSYADGRIPQDALLKVLRTVAELGVFTKEVIQSQLSEQELEKEIARVKDKVSTLKIKRKENYPEILMGKLMEKVRGRIDAKIVAKKVGFLGKVKFNG
ncbi:MAG: glutamyl-tRNA(Gln) amidotransferase subunit E [Ignavibacteria bacterium RBG_16_34_14]|nr:MAG: glutamyl-tRNA(Gln) amidotransferase subunit E [Ignavibacteria bacterium RBG_16_34_14]